MKSFCFLSAAALSIAFLPIAFAQTPHPTAVALHGPSSPIATAPLAKTAPAAAQAPDAHLAAVLAQMDTASQNFKSAQANFTKEFYQRIVRETTTDTGAIYFERKGSGTQMGAVRFDPDGKTKNQVYEFKDGTLRILDVKTGQPPNTVKSGSNQSMIETFLTLGFGGSGQDLARQWTITDQGPETLTDSGQQIKTEKLDLVSKDTSIQKTFTHVTIWVDPVRGVSLRQVFETPSHDKQTTTYSHIKLNGKIDADYFALKKGK